MIDSKRRAGSGFTILEMLISLFLIMLILGIVIFSVGSTANERRLMDPAVTLRSFAKKAKRSAVSEQRSYTIFLYPQAFVLEETYPVMVEEEEEDAGEALFAEDREAEEDAERAAVVVSLRHDMAEDVVFEMRRWNADEWLIPDEEEPVEWVFTPSGLCEPISVRFAIDNNWVELDFNPLTAGVEEERFYIK